MKSKYYITALFILSSLLLWTACSDSSTGNIPDDLTGESVTYELIPANDSSIDGKVTFDERVDGDVQVAIELNGLEEEEEEREQEDALSGDDAQVHDQQSQRHRIDDDERNGHP